MCTADPGGGEADMPPPTAPNQPPATASVHAPPVTTTAPPATATAPYIGTPVKEAVKVDYQKMYEDMITSVDMVVLWCFVAFWCWASHGVSAWLGGISTGLACALAVMHICARHLVATPALIVNIFLIAPFNVLALLGFILLTPMRYAWNHMLVYYMVPKMDPSTPITFWSATRDKWVMAIRPSLKQLFHDDIDTLSPTAARAVFDKCSEWPVLRKLVNAHIPAWVFKSLLGRYLTTVIGLPMSWFLADLTFLSFLPLHPSEKNPPLNIVLPSCAFLNLARERAGRDGGNIKCVNE